MLKWAMYKNVKDRIAVGNAEGRLGRLWARLMIVRNAVRIIIALQLGSPL